MEKAFSTCAVVATKKSGAARATHPKPHIATRCSTDEVGPQADPGSMKIICPAGLFYWQRFVEAARMLNPTRCR